MKMKNENEDSDEVDCQKSGSKLTSYFHSSYTRIEAGLNDDSTVFLLLINPTSLDIGLLLMKCSGSPPKGIHFHDIERR